MPLHTVRLLATCGLNLLLWFLAGEAARFALLYLGTEISHGDYRQVRLVLTMTVFTAMVATTLVVTVGMLHTLRGALTEIRARRAEGGGDERYLVALDRVAPAFAVIYMTWGFTGKDAADFVQLDFLHHVDQTFAAGSDIGRGLIDLDVRVSLIAMFAAWVVRLIASRRYDSGRGRFSGAVTAFAELAFAFYGLNATFTIAGQRSDWMAHRNVVAGAQGMIAQAEEKVPGWAAFWAWVGDVWPFLVEALVLPLTWLAVGILVFGADINDTRAVIRGTRAERAAQRLDQTHNMTRQLVERLTGSFQERWIPIFHALRLSVRGGAPLFGMFCLSYVAITIGVGYAMRGLRWLIGSPSEYIWLVVGPPVTLLGQLVGTLLTMCLLAATFDIASTRARALGTADDS